MKPLPLLSLFALLLGALFLAGDPARGQGKKNDPEEARLRQQIHNLQRELREREQKINQLQAQLKKENTEDKKRDKELTAARKGLDAVKQADVIRTLLFKRKPDAGQAEVKKLLDAAPKALGKPPGVRAVYAGKSAASDYQVGIVLLFDDTADLKKFAQDAGQKKFVKGLEKTWEPPTVYDFQP